MNNKNKEINKKEITKIYLVTNCYNEPNSIYIGKTINSREKSHRMKFGNQIIYTYIDCIYSLDRKKWGPLESYWIEQFRQWGFKILNKNKGGSGPSCHTKETKMLLRTINEGRIMTQTHKQNIGKSLTGIPKPLGFGVKPDGFGEKVSKSHIGLLKPKPPGFGEKMSNINKGKKRNDNFKSFISNFLKGNKYRAKIVYQYDMEDNFIKEWESIKEITEKLGFAGSGISNCINNKQKTAYGYKWKNNKKEDLLRPL
jgi:hypothetical protein